MDNDDLAKKRMQKAREKFEEDYARKRKVQEASVRLEAVMDTMNWLAKIYELGPIKLPDNCGVLAMPHFKAAFARLNIVCLKTKLVISAFLDTTGSLSGNPAGTPYWEAKADHDDPHRFDFCDKKGLEEYIAKSVRKFRGEIE